MDGDGGREIWFQRILWSYMPCHWKGWLLLAATILTIVATQFLLEAVIPQPTSIWLEILRMAPFAVGFIWLWWITERHCAPPK